MTFTTLQILLINNIMYMLPESGPFPKLKDYKNRKVKEFIHAIDLEGWSDPEAEDTPMTTAREWKQVVNAIRNDPMIMDLLIKDEYTDQSKEGGSCRSAVFISESTLDAFVVFQGTEVAIGSLQWRDNFTSCTVSDSPHQQRALKWFKQVCHNHKLGQYEVTVTGHSKGGNKAKYITILNRTPSHCVSFNGEGFSDKFFHKYKDRIVARKHKIENHIVNYDYVSLLLNDIGEETYYYGNNYGSGGFTENHLVNTFFRFDPEGGIHMDVAPEGRPAEMKAFDEFANSYLRSLDDTTRKSATRTMFGVLNSILSVDKTMDPNEVIHVFLELAKSPANRRNIAYFLAYIIRFRQERPEVSGLLSSVFEKFDLNGLIQYIDMADQILGWQKRILFVRLDFMSISKVAATLVKHVPDKVLKRLSGDIAKKGIELNEEELKQLQTMLVQMELDMRTLTIPQEQSDLKAV